CSSDLQLTHELDVAGPAHTEMGVEASVVCGGRYGRAQIGRRLGKVRVVERVEEAGAELEGKALRESECALDVDIECVQSRGHDRITWTVSKGAIRRRSKRSGQHIGLCQVGKLIPNGTDTVRTFMKVCRSALPAKGKHR